MSDAGTVMRDRRVLVAGGGRGIGRACAELLATHGASVMVADPSVSLGGSERTGDAAAEVARAIRDRGGDALHTPLGIGDLEDGRRLVALCLERWGALDAVVVPAMVLRDRMVWNLSQEDWDMVVRTNLSGVFGLVAAAVPTMRGRGYGRIVTFTSRAGIQGTPGTANYSAAKMGVIGLVNTVAKEVERYGIRINCVAPRAQTRASGHALGERPAEGAALDYATLGAPEDVALLVQYLASERCEVTGRTFTCSGRELGIYPPPEAVPLSDGRTPMTYDRLHAWIGAHARREADGLTP